MKITPLLPTRHQVAVVGEKENIAAATPGDLSSVLVSGDVTITESVLVATPRELLLPASLGPDSVVVVTGFEVAPLVARLVAMTLDVVAALVLVLVAVLVLLLLLVGTETVVVEVMTLEDDDDDDDDDDVVTPN